MNARAYLAYTRIQLRENFRYFWTDAFWNGALTTFFAFLVLFFYEAAGTKAFYGLTWPMIVWYLFAVQFVSQPVSNFVRTITLQIRSGEVVTRMSRPSSYVIAAFYENIGTATPSMLACAAIMIPLALVLTGTATLTPLSVALFILCAMLALVLDFVISLSIGLIAFWTEDARPYRWIYSKTVFIIGGLFFPLDIYPESIRVVVKLLPPAFLAYYPAMVLVNPTPELVTMAIGGALVWIGIMAIVAAFVWRRAVRRVEVNGG